MKCFYFFCYAIYGFLLHYTKNLCEDLVEELNSKISAFTVIKVNNGYTVSNNMHMSFEIVSQTRIYLDSK